MSERRREGDVSPSPLGEKVREAGMRGMSPSSGTSTEPQPSEAKQVEIAADGDIPLIRPSATFSPRGEGAVATTCPYCGVGCGVLATPGPDGTLAVEGDPDHPANLGRLCSKGAALGETVELEGRLLHPRIGGRRATWDEAIARVADGFRETIRLHGPDSVAFYVSGQLLTEDYYLANKLMKGAIGSANIDTNSRLCMASTVAGHVRAFGEDIVPQCYEDIEEADLVVLVGSNLAWCHPVLHRRLMAAKEARGTRIVAVDPRRTATAEDADLHLAIRPDGDAALFVGLLRHLGETGRFDFDWTNEHVSGLASALSAAAPYDLRRTARETDLAPADVAAFFDLFARTERALTIFSQGVNQSAHGTDKVSSILNVHLATGRIGKPGCGPLSATGQPNAMGGREVGGLANQLAAHMGFDDASVDRVRRFWSYERIADAPGLKAIDMFRAVADGRIKAIWIMGTNPAVSLPEADGVREALADCPLVVVSDVEASTDTVKLAHVALPALAWGEKSGTVTNTERRISRQRAVLPAPGEARADWRIVHDVARAMGFEGFDHASEAEVFAEHAALSAFENDGARAFDIGRLAGLSVEAYDTLAPLQWPVRGGPASGGRLFAEGGFPTPTGRARLSAVIPPTLEPVVGAPTLNTGRVRDHWHTMTRTRRSARLSRHCAEPFLEVHPADAVRLGIAAASLVHVESAHGRCVLRALVTERVREGEVFAPMHWTGETAPSGRIGALVPARTDPHSGQPASKRVRVTVRPAEMAWHGFALLRERPAAIPAPYWALARTEGGWRVELAGHSPASLVSTREALLGEAPPIVLAGALSIAADPGRGAMWSSAGPVAVARDWASDLFAAPDPFPALLAGRPGADMPDPGPTVCSCMQVGLNAILDAVAAGASDVDAVGRATTAGTSCGSCRPEIGRLCHAERFLQAAE